MRHQMSYDDIPEEVRTMICDVCHEMCIPISESELPTGLEELTICWACNHQGELAQKIALVVVNARKDGYQEVSWNRIRNGDRIRHIVINRSGGPKLSDPVIVMNRETRICRTSDNLGYFSAQGENVVFLDPIRN